MKKIKPIILYFKIENAEEKGMFLDTFESKTFKEIIEDLKNKYSDIKFIGNKLYFNETRIDQHKTPQFYKIPSENIQILNLLEIKYILMRLGLINIKLHSFIKFLQKV